MSVISYSIEVVTWRELARDMARDTARVTLTAIDGVARRALAKVNETVIR